MSGGWRNWLRRLGWRKTRLIDRLAQPLDELLTALVQDSTTGLLIIDRAGRIVRVNETLRRMLDAEVSSGGPALNLFPPEERAEIWEVLAPALAGRRPPPRFATRLGRPGAADEPAMEVSGVVLREADGSISGLILRLSDISVQKRLEAQLAHSQKLQAVGQLAGGIAHDFNNLLTAIIGAADMVLVRPDTAGEAREDVVQIRRSAERGAALVRQLLAFGRQQTLQPRIVRVNAAITDIADLLRRLLGGRVVLELDLETPGRMVRVDPSQLDQVLVNLAVNARDAMPEGGRLILRSGHVTLFRPQIRGSETIPPGRYVMIEVEDSGVGIPPEVLPRIFDPFFTTRRERGGNGLGLSTVHGIVRQSDGFLAVESEAGRGSRFRIYLPRHDVAEAPAAALPAPAVMPTAIAAPAAGRLVVLVEDEEPVRKLAERALRQQGWRVLGAETAEAALASLATQHEAPAALVSDVVMPGIDGPALVRQLRARWPGLPALLVSGYAAEALRRDLAAEDMRFLPKPYTLKALTALLAEATAPVPSREPENHHGEDTVRSIQTIK
jgi:two-component system cell cycle sensor histidine kinase/response regulator CckA